MERVVVKVDLQYGDFIKGRRWLDSESQKILKGRKLFAFLVTSIFAVVGVFMVSGDKQAQTIGLSVLFTFVAISGISYLRKVILTKSIWEDNNTTFGKFFRMSLSSDGLVEETPSSRTQ